MEAREYRRLQVKARHWVRSHHVPSTPCAVCGALLVHGHHPDYRKPEEIVWLCSKHHAAERIGKPRDYQWLGDAVQANLRRRELLSALLEIRSRYSQFGGRPTNDSRLLKYPTFTSYLEARGLNPRNVRDWLKFSQLDARNTAARGVSSGL